MLQCHLIQPDTNRLVGDPIDVITGACLDVSTDFKLMAPLPLTWYRYYDSSQHRRACPLGWGHTHEYDRRLVFDLDGIRYIAPVGQGTGFPPLEKDGTSYSSEGKTLIRQSAGTYRVMERGQPDMDFRLDRTLGVGLLTCVRQGKHEINFSYNRQGHLELITDSLRRHIRVQLDEKGRIVSLILQQSTRGNPRVLLGCAYDKAGNFVEGVDAYQNRFRFTYDHNNRMLSRTDRRGFTFLFEYDDEGRCTHATGQDGHQEVRLSYDPLSRVTEVVRGDGGKWEYYYDEFKNLKLILDPYGGVRKFNLDDEGRVGEEVDANEAVTEYVYDETGALTGKRSPTGMFVPYPEERDWPDEFEHRVPNCYSEWEFGDLLDWGAVQLPPSDDPVLRRLPEFARKCVHTIAPSEIPIKNSQWKDESNSRAGVDLHNNGKVFDELGLLLKETFPDGTSRRWIYDSAGNRQRYHDRDGGTFEYQYGSWDLRCKETDPLGHETIYGHSFMGEIASVRDHLRNTTEFVYDLKDRICKVVRDGELMEEYRYDNSDNLVEKLAGNGERLSQSVIGDNNLEQSRRLTSGEEYEFAYDEWGRYIRIASEETELSFAYAPTFNRVAMDKRDGQGVEHVYLGRRLAATTVFEKFTTEYRKHPDQVLEIIDPAGGSHRLTLLEHGLIERRSSNGTVEVSQIDSRGKCLTKALQRSKASRGTWQRKYQYSGEGYLTSVNDNHRGNAEYSYDRAHRLVEEKIAARGERTFRYDEAGNLLGQPGLNEVSVERGNRLRSANGDQFEYSQRDDLILRRGASGTTSYTYDSEDNLTACERNGQRWTATYDALARRIRKSWSDKTVEFFWDMDRLIAEIDEQGRVRIYIYADGFSIVPIMFLDYSDIDADPSDGERYFVYSNQIGAPVLVENNWGDPVWSATYDPYGRATISEQASIAFSLRFPGHYWDEELSLNYNRFRYYSPELGRYIQADPLGVAAGTNVYAYALGNPVGSVDVRGECPDSDGDSSSKKKGKKRKKEPKPPPKQSDPNPVRKVIREEYENVISGNGTPRIDPATGAQTVFQAREFGGGRNVWRGSLEWDVPGTSHRILQRTDGRLGYVVDHDYSKPKLFPGPWYPDGG